VERRFKVELLTRIIDLYDLKLGIIFCNTKRMVDDLVEHLNAQGYSADRLHGDMTQVMRDRVMNRFRKSGLEFLVATDVAARGIDVENVEVVFNYDLPYDVEDYLHRIGRTGRAGRSGRAIAFASGREVFQIRQIERFTNVKMQRGKPPSAQDVENALANLFLDRIRTTLKSADIRKHEPMVERLLEEGFSSTDVACGLLQLLQAGEAAAPGQTAGVESRPAARPDMERKKERYQSDRTPNFDKRPREQHTAAQRFQPAIKPAPRPAEVTDRPKKLKPEQQPIRQAPEAKTPPPEERTEPKKETSPQAAAKPSRRTPEEQTRLFMNVGAEMGIGPDDVVGTILGETGLPANIVGAIDVRERHLFVDVATEHSKAIIAKLNRTQIKNRKLKVKIA
jgi:ATP-dependent RNA helicase DeaD